MKFAAWLDTFLQEKGTDLEQVLEVEGETGLNMIPVGIVVDAIKSAAEHEQVAIKNMLVKIDFVNGDHMDFIRHLAKAIAL